MTTNVGTIDRILRAALGLGLLYLSFLSGMPAFEAGLMKYGAVGVVMLVVATTRVCPIYSIFGFKTCRA